jgi:hypothetical protein
VFDIFDAFVKETTNLSPFIPFNDKQSVTMMRKIYFNGHSKDYFKE